MKELSWEPRKHGLTYCSSACGRGCTIIEFDKATNQAAMLALKLGPLWVPEVWENLGWHWNVKRGPWTVNPLYDGAGYNTITGYTAKLGNGRYSWLGKGETAIAAMNDAKLQARAEIKQLMEILTELQSET